MFFVDKALVFRGGVPSIEVLLCTNVADGRPLWISSRERSMFIWVFSILKSKLPGLMIKPPSNATEKKLLPISIPAFMKINLKLQSLPAATMLQLQTTTWNSVSATQLPKHSSVAPRSSSKLTGDDGDRPGPNR